MTVTAPITNANGQLLFMVTNTFPTQGNHPTGQLYTPIHPLRYATGPVEPNYWAYDVFLTSIVSTSTNLPVLVPHVPILLSTLTVTITIEYNYKTTNLYSITNVLSERDTYSSGRIEIRKAGSGTHIKEYAAPDSPQ